MIAYRPLTGVDDAAVCHPGAGTSKLGGHHLRAPGLPFAAACRAVAWEAVIANDGIDNQSGLSQHPPRQQEPDR